MAKSRASFGGRRRRHHRRRRRRPYKQIAKIKQNQATIKILVFKSDKMLTLRPSNCKPLLIIDLEECIGAKAV